MKNLTVFLSALVALLFSVAETSAQITPPYYNPANVRITGGTINGAVIGGTTAAAGSFTSVNASSGIASSIGAGGLSLTNAAFGNIVSTNTLYVDTVANAIVLRPFGVERGSFSSTGLAVNGALSAGGLTTLLSGAGTGTAAYSEVEIAASKYKEIKFATTNTGTDSGAGFRGGLNSGGSPYGALTLYAGNSGTDFLVATAGALTVNLSGATQATVTPTGLTLGTGVNLVTSGTLSAAPTLASTSGTANGVYIPVTVAQSGTAGYNGLWLDVSVASAGSGTKNLLRVTTGGASDVLVATNTSLILGAGVNLVMSGSTVAGLPAGVIGMRSYVTDALAPAFGAAVVGGGAVVIPVFYNGAAWIVG